MILLMVLFGCSQDHFNAKIEDRNLIICFAMKADGDCSE